MNKITQINRKIMFYILIIFSGLLYYDCTGNNTQVSIIIDENHGPSVSHGIIKLTESLKERGISFEKVTNLDVAKGNVIILTGLSSGGGVAAQLLEAENRKLDETSEALEIWKTEWENKKLWVVSGFDDRGLMYALLDIADRISWGLDEENFMSEVKEVSENPAVSERAVSIYTMNRKYWETRFYDEDYWAVYLDMLAQNRYNTLVVIFGYENGGFLAPAYPYFFDMEEFPTVKMVGITSEEQDRNLKALNKLIEIAHNRGIQFKVGIWDHIYRGGVQGGGIPGTREAPSEPVHGLVWGVESDNLTSYNKAALAKFIKLVPDLDAIQFRMHNESGLKHEEQDLFWLDVFKMIKETSPELKIDLRAKELPPSVIESAINVDINFRIATKYWMEQMGMPYHPTRVNPEKSPIRHSYASLLSYPQKFKMHWRLWNGGTTRILLWGDPEYARRFTESTHLYDGDGFEINEPLATKMEAQPHDEVPFDLLNPDYKYYQWEFERYWHFFQVFGRIGYNPDASAEIWQKEFESRFGKKAGLLIETALHKASWILPRIVTSVYPYRGFPTTRGWAEKQRLGDLPVYSTNEGSDLMQFANFEEEALMLIEGKEYAKILPSTNSFWFEQTSNEINQLIEDAENAIELKPNKEFTSTIVDLKILSNLALYHSRRIPAAVSYRLFEHTKDPLALEAAIEYERNAIEAWKQIVEAAGVIYTDDLKLGVCIADLCGHWKDELIALEDGLAKLEQKISEVKASGSKIRNAPKYKPVTNSDYNKLFEITHNHVTEASLGEPITISMKAETPAGIKWARLRYRSVNQEEDYATLQFNSVGDKDHYQAIVPADKIDFNYDFMYLIELMDNNGTGRIFPDSNKETPYVFVKFNR